MASMSNEILEKYIFKIYGISAFKPTKLVNGKRKQDRGFKYIRLARPLKKTTHDVPDGSEAVAMAGSASDSRPRIQIRLHPNAAVAKGICQVRPAMPTSGLPSLLPSVLPRAAPSPSVLISSSVPISSSAAPPSSAAALRTHAKAVVRYILIYIYKYIYIYIYIYIIYIYI